MTTPTIEQLTSARDVLAEQGQTHTEFLIAALNVAISAHELKAKLETAEASVLALREALLLCEKAFLNDAYPPTIDNTEHVKVYHLRGDILGAALTKARLNLTDTAPLAAKIRQEIVDEAGERAASKCVELADDDNAKAANSKNATEVAILRIAESAARVCAAAIQTLKGKPL